MTKEKKLERKFNRKIAKIEKKMTTAYQRRDMYVMDMYDIQLGVIVDKYLSKRAKYEKQQGYQVDIDILCPNGKIKVDIRIQNLDINEQRDLDTYRAYYSESLSDFKLPDKKEEKSQNIPTNQNSQQGEILKFPDIKKNNEKNGFGK